MNFGQPEMPSQLLQTHPRPVQEQPRVTQQRFEAPDHRLLRTTVNQASVQIPSRIQPSVQIPSRIQPSVQIPSRVQPEVQITSRIQPEVKIPTRVQPEVQITSRVQPEVKIPSRVQPEVQITSRIQPEVQIPPRIQTSIASQNLRQTPILAQPSAVSVVQNQPASVPQVQRQPLSQTHAANAAANASFEVERSKYKTEMKELQDKLAAAYKEIDLLKRQLEAKSQPSLPQRAEPLAVIRADRPEPVVTTPLRPVYTGLPQGSTYQNTTIVTDWRANRPAATIQIRSESVHVPSTFISSNTNTMTRPIESHARVLPQENTQVLRPEPPRIVQPPIQQFQTTGQQSNIQVIGQASQVQTITANLHQSPYDDLLRATSRGTSSSLLIANHTELNHNAAKQNDDFVDRYFALQDTKKKEASKYVNPQGPSLEDFNPRKSNNIFSTPESKRSRSRSPPPAPTSTSGANAKLKEANARIRYLADENDKLIGRLHKYKIVEEELQKREINFEKKMAIILQEKLEAEKREEAAEMKAYEEQVFAEKLSREIAEYKSKLQTLTTSVESQLQASEQPAPATEDKPKGKKLKGVKRFEEEDPIIEVPDDITSPKPDNKPEETVEVIKEAPKKKKEKKAKGEVEDQPREEIPVPHETQPEPQAEPVDDGKTKKTKKKKAKAEEEIGSPVEEVPVEPQPVQGEPVEGKKKKGTKKKKEE